MLTPIAIRVTSDQSVGKRKLEANKIYYLQDGFEIRNEGNYLYIESYRLEPDKLYNDYFRDSCDTPDISIMAIVGENGSGKSSLIEFYIRLVNNFAATTIGELKINSTSEHLHFINGVEGEFYYLIDTTPYRLKIQNRNVVLESYSTKDSTKDEFGRCVYLLYNTADIFDNEMSIERNTDNAPIPSLKPSLSIRQQQKNTSLSDIYKHFFYSFVSNYSFYAYNTFDFADECNTDDYEEEIRKAKKRKYSIENRNWLNGIFHKNDGYQTPIVLSPFRTEGNMNVNTENELSRERLTALLIMPKSQFRYINDHLEVIGFRLTKRNIKYDAKFLKQEVGFLRLQQRGYNILRDLILEYWSEALAIQLIQNDQTRHCYEEAVGYLVYKTLKISKTYTRQYGKFFNSHKGVNYKINSSELKQLIFKLNKDHSHITKKIRHILAYIVYGIYEIDSDINSSIVKIADASRVANEIISKLIHDENGIRKQFIFSIEDLVPPRIYDVSIELNDIKTNDSVPFETLSSGERQQVYSISSLLYHLSNLESVWHDMNNQRIGYQHVNIIMEEVELYFHPELQRTYIKRLFDGLKQIQIPHIKSLNICFVTHSPFILSDIPTRNILALKIENNNIANNDVQLSTFGANIHDMLKNSFFLKNGSIGAYADWIIRQIIEEMSDIQLHSHIDSKMLHKTIMLIDEPIVRMALLNEYHHVFPDTSIEMRIMELERQIRELKNNQK